MAWMEVHQTLPTHRKTLQVADALEIEPALVVGHLVCFWLWALDNAPAGTLAATSPRMIARAAQWTGDPMLFMSALVGAGFLEEDPAGALVIHDWSEYAGRYFAQRQAQRERQRKHRVATNGSDVDVTPPSQECHADVTPMSRDVTLLHNNNNDPNNDPDPGSDRDHKKDNVCFRENEIAAKQKKQEYTPAFEEFWKTYPRRTEKVKAFRTWKARLKAGYEAADLVAAAGNYAEYHRRKGTESNFLKLPATFIGPDEHFAEWMTLPDGALTGPLRDKPPVDTRPLAFRSIEAAIARAKTMKEEKLP